MVFLRLKYLFSRYAAVEAGCHSGRQEQKLGIALCGLGCGAAGCNHACLAGTKDFNWHLLTGFLIRSPRHIDSI